MQSSWMSLQYSCSCIIIETIPFLVLPLHKSHTLLISPIKNIFNFGKLYLKKRTQRIRELFNRRQKGSTINLPGGQLCSRPPGEGSDVNGGFPQTEHSLPDNDDINTTSINSPLSGFCILKVRALKGTKWKHIWSFVSSMPKAAGAS